MQNDYVQKKLNYDFHPTPYVHPRDRTQAFDQKITFDMFLIYCISVYMRNFSKNIDNWGIAKFKYLTFDPT